MPEKLPITVLMLTLNEEHHLPAVLDNLLDWAEDIFIIDSLSTDRTVDIALERGVKIVQRPFTNFADQWNFALSMPVTTPWSMKIDPDERLTDQLKQNIAEAIRTNAADGFSFSRRLWFTGKPLRITQDIVRVWKHGKCHFPAALVNEHPEVDGTVKHLPGLMEHLDSYGMYHWMAKQNRYTTMEAISYCTNASLAATPRMFGNKLERRMFMKKNFWKIPLRYQMLFVYLYLLRGAWMKGRVGLSWVHARIMVMRLREIKIHEIRATGVIPEIPKGKVGQFDPRVIHTDLQRQVFPIEK